MSVINFKRLNEALLASFASYLSLWLPDGKTEGHEFKARNPTRADNKSGSFSVNISTGKWADFATGDKGGDPVSLYAYLQYNGDQGAAARDLARQLNIDIEAPTASMAQESKPADKSESPWKPIIPAPKEALPYPVAHPVRGVCDKSWVYKDVDDEIIGVVYRFTKSDGGKEVLPCVYAEHVKTKKREWRWLSFPEPRPLYGMWRWNKQLPILIVEGEKCADIAHELVGDQYTVLTWPGGCKAVEKADWSYLANMPVILWPDADSKRRKLTKQEIAINVDPNSVEYLPADEQPGHKAMYLVARKLIEQGCKVRWLKLPDPGVLPDGWDIADAVEDGWDRDRISDFIAGKYSLRAPANKGGGTPGMASAGVDRGLIRKPRGGLEECRENVYLILSQHPDWEGVIAYNEFTDTVQKLKPTPAGGKPGDWSEDDDYATGLWLAQQMDLVIKSDGALVSGVHMAAKLKRFHPVRDYLHSIKWDRVNRLDRWLMECLGVEPGDDDGAYCKLAGKYFLIGMVARAMRPGCPMQNMLVLEGKQGKGKSTALRILGGEWFADTPFKIGDKDSYLALRGKWLYEIAEMDAFNRSETTAVKAFISIQTDHYREPYARRMVDRHRQTVFCGTTNQGEYFKDTTGNRRSWPVKTGDIINLAKLREWRDQLFAEAFTRFNDGERWYPSREEETKYFQPEQETREIVDPWYEQLSAFLTANVADEFTSMQLLEDGLFVKPDKVDGNRSMATRIGSIMAKLGWEKRRESTGTRRWLYCRPKPNAEVAKQRIQTLTAESIAGEF